MVGRLIALRLPPGRSFWTAVEDAWARGDAVLPLPVAAPDRAVAALLSALRPHVLVDGEGALEQDDPEPVAPEVALVITTSGTSGRPKGVEITRAALEASATASDARLESAADDRWLCCLPVSHIAGFQVLFRSGFAGLPVVVHTRFDPAEVAAEDDVTLVSLVPTMLRRLLDAGVDLRRFRAVLVGGAPTPPELLRRARAAGANIVRSYGMTETCGGCVYDGMPLEGVEVSVGASGRVLIRGPVLARGYRSRPDLTTRAFADGWFRSDDLGQIDEFGRLQVLGRADDVIVTGGEKVDPSEVAVALSEHPLVADVSVFGAGDPEWGERVVAIVVPVSGSDPPTLADARAFLGSRLAAYKLPKELIVANVPRAAESGDQT
jgi:o-succinylbenzoate---CoA ligase